MKKTLKFNIEVEIEIDGTCPSDQFLIDKTIDAINNGFPSLIFDDEELDCAALVDSWSVELKKQTIGQSADSLIEE